MMFVSPHLSFDPTESLSPEVERLCNMAAEIPPEVNQSTFRAGQWWVYPLGRAGGHHLVGLRLTPGTALVSSSVVIARGPQAITIASSPAYLVPIRVHDNMMGGGARWDEIAKLSKATWKALVALHHTLGGADDLDELRKLTTDKAVKRAYEKGSADYAGMVRTRAESLTRLDAATETQVYARYLVNAAVEGVAPTPAPEAGCWNPAIATLALFMSQNDPDDQPRRDEELWAAWRVMHQLPGLDTARSGTGIIATDSTATAVALNTSAAKVVTKRKDKAWASDPVLAAAAKLATVKTYDGAAHLEAAAALDKAGDAAGAFTQMAAATYWRAQAKGAADPKALDAARKLARRAAWTEVADSLDELHQTERDLEAEG
jgi:hypothetical protein